jgi:hypothetical protein
MTSPAGPPPLPDAVRQHLKDNPDVLSALLQPNVVAALAQSDADWCIACGASASQAARALAPVDPAQLSDEHIRALAARILGTAGGGS